MLTSDNQDVEERRVSAKKTRSGGVEDEWRRNGEGEGHDVEMEDVEENGTRRTRRRRRRRRRTVREGRGEEGEFEEDQQEEDVDENGKRQWGVAVATRTYG